MNGLDKVSRSAENSALVDRSMGVALQRMADVYLDMGKTEDAFAKYEASLKIFDRLRAEEATNDWIKWNRAVSYDKLGDMSQEFHGDARAAHEYYRNSLALREALLAKVLTPTIEPMKRRKAVSVSYIKLANLSKELGDPAKARDYARAALEESQEVLRLNAADAQAASFVTTANFLLGKATAHLGESDASRRYFRACLEIRRKAVKDDPASADAKRQLGALYDAVGDMELEVGNGTVALESYRQAHELYAALVKKEKDSAEDQWYLGGSYYRLGTTKLLLHDPSAAAKDYAECLKLRAALAKADPGSVQMQAELMLAQARYGQHAQASTAAEALRKRSAKNPSVLFTAACGLALCAAAVESDHALRDRYANAAVETLKQAIALGYRDREALKLEPDLETLRKSPAFPALLDRLAKS